MLQRYVCTKNTEACVSFAVSQVKMVWWDNAHDRSASNHQPANHAYLESSCRCIPYVKLFLRNHSIWAFMEFECTTETIIPIRLAWIFLEQAWLYHGASWWGGIGGVEPPCKIFNPLAFYIFSCLGGLLSPLVPVSAHKYSFRNTSA